MRVSVLNYPILKGSVASSKWKCAMTNPEQTIDYDRLADLRLRLRHTRNPDFALGAAIVALLLPDTIAAASADAWLAQPKASISMGLDITGSAEDALRLLGQLGFGPGWTIQYDDTEANPSNGIEGRYGVWLRHRYFECLGTGQTRATALVDVAIHGAALGGADYEEEEAILLTAGEGSPPVNDEKAPIEVMEGWADDPVERTRQVLDEFWPNLDIRGRICLKNSDGRFGTMDGYELHEGILRVVDRTQATCFRYETVERLLAAGWVLD